MDFDVYQEKAKVTAIYPRDVAVVYPMVGLANESGEALGKVKKYLRRDHTLEEAKPVILAELGDCLWYIALVAEDLGVSLTSVAEANLRKLADRAERGKIRGDGDNR